MYLFLSGVTNDSCALLGFCTPYCRAFFDRTSDAGGKPLHLTTMLVRRDLAMWGVGASVLKPTVGALMGTPNACRVDISGDC